MDISFPSSWEIISHTECTLKACIVVSGTPNQDKLDNYNLVVILFVLNVLNRGEIEMEDGPVSNMIYRVVLLGVQEIIGENGLKTVLNFSGLKQYINNFPPNNHDIDSCMASEIGRLEEGVVDIFGENGAYAVLYQVGRMQAKWGLEENPDVVNAAKEAIKDLSEREKVKTVLSMTAATIAADINFDVWVDEEGDDFLYKHTDVSHCFNKKSNKPQCHSYDGFLFEITAWATDNTDWVAKEESCIAMGKPNCTFRIKKVRET